MDDWYFDGLEDDLRARMKALRLAGQRFALATVTAAEGGGPRGRGAQMVITCTDLAGFVSGGCIEADIALHARDVLADGEPRRLVYGRGSPFADARLPCGGRLELLVEAIQPDDPALSALLDAYDRRAAGVWISDGRRRRFEAEARPAGSAEIVRPYAPQLRLVVVGGDAFALALAETGRRMAWEVVVCRPSGPTTPPWTDVDYRRDRPGAALAALRPDRWTAVAAMTHDPDLDHETLQIALPSDAGYVGVLGARRRLDARLERLRAAGVSPEALARLHAPIGLAIGSRSPREVALAIAAEILSSMRT